MQPRHHTPHLTFLVALGASMGMMAVTPTAQAAEKPASAKKSVSQPAGAAPTSLGNNIFVLGEDTPASAASISIPPRAALPKRSTTAPRSINAALLGFCRGYLGRKLGNGQCSELAALGIPAVGGQIDWNRLWGTPVCSFSASGGRFAVQVGSAGRNSKHPRQLDVRPGDIIQYEGVKFERSWNGGSSYQEYPHHTSVIESVSPNRQTYKVLEQNVDGTQYVLETVLHLPELTQGTMTITRPIAR